MTPLVYKHRKEAAGMRNFIDVFERTEQKYLLDRLQYKEIRRRLARHTVDDPYGLSAVCNIYYDTPGFELIRRSLDKPKYKEKLRLRSYGVPGGSDPVFVEIKKKFNGIVYKRRIALPYAQAVRYLNEGVRPDVCSQIMREINYFMDYYKPAPAVYLAYDRLACCGAEDNGVRITFDSNIRSRRDALELSLGDFGDSVLKEGNYLMEIKIAGAMPLWLVDILSESELYPTSFSKYGSVYTGSICKAADSISA